MFEVSWCVGLYVTILATGVPAGRAGAVRPATGCWTLWQKWSGAYVAVRGHAVRLHDVAQRRLRGRDRRRLRDARVAVPGAGPETSSRSCSRSRPSPCPRCTRARSARCTCSCRTCSSSQWWSPVMPISFFLSSIVAGSALVILIDMWIAKGWHRRLDMTTLASVGKITFWSLDGLPRLPARRHGAPRPARCAPSRAGWASPSPRRLSLGGLVPLVAPRAPVASAPVPSILFWAALLAVLGVVYNRMNVVLFAMTFRGRMPWGRPQSYAPSIFEWGISVGLIAATIFLFGLGARLFPVLAQAGGERRPLSRVNADGWLAAHSYLQPVARFCAQVDRAAAGLESADRRPFPTGTTMPPISGRACRSCRAPTPPRTSSPREPGSSRLVERLASLPLEGALAADAAALAVDLRRRADACEPRRGLAARRRFVRARVSRPAPASRVDRDGPLPPRPCVEAFGRWRDEERWLRHYCPTVRIRAGDGAAVRRGPRTPPAPGVRPLRYALAIQANRLSLLRGRQPAAVRPGRRGRGRAADRLLRVLRRLPQDVRRAGGRRLSCCRTGPPSISTSSPATGA